MDGETARVIGVVMILGCWLAGPFWWAVFLAGCCCLALGGAHDAAESAIAVAASPAEADSAFGCGLLSIVLIGGGFLFLVFAAASVGGL